MEGNSKRPKELRKWSEESMISAFNAVKSGNMSISSAAKMFKVPRMTLSDRINGKVSLNAKMGVKTALTEDEELALCNYISYMANRGFPLTIQQLIGFAWCIAREHGKESVFTKSGPSRKWWKGFKNRHPDLSLRRPDPLDRGRACFGNVNAIRDYFQLLKETIESNDLKEKPDQIYNCDEAALFFNKSAGQKVIVPTRTRHPHSLSVATSEHISVHCCVNAAGQALPPMLIYSKSLPGGSYHKQGPINASYAYSDSGFMDQALYHQWFMKTFLPHAVPRRPLLLIQDGASSHVSVNLIKSAIENDIILLCLPPKTTHITQPLDVAVYRKMKIETAKLVSQSKMLKSDLWISKKQVSGMFKIIFEKSFTMNCITEGFRKCGIYPFDPNAIDKTLLLRSNTSVDTLSLDLSVTDKPALIEESQVLNDSDITDNSDVSYSLAPNTSDLCQESLTQSDENIFDITFIVGDDGILTLEPDQPKNSTTNEVLSSSQECPPDLALSAVELSLTPRKKRKFEECYNMNIELSDQTYQTWRRLKNTVYSPVAENTDTEIYTAVPFSPETLPIPPTNTPMQHVNPSVQHVNTKINYPMKETSTITNHPLVKAGLIPDDLVNVLVVPQIASKRTKRDKGKARVLTSIEVQREIEEKEAAKRQKNELKEQRKQERIKKKIERENIIKQKKEEMKKKKEIKQKQKEEKLQHKKRKTKTQSEISIAN